MEAANSTEAAANFYKFHSIIFFTVVTLNNPTPALYEANKFDEDKGVLKNGRSWHMNFTNQKNRLRHNFARATHRGPAILVTCRTSPPFFRHNGENF